MSRQNQKKNLAPEFDLEVWNTWTPREQTAPLFTKDKIKDDVVLRIGSGGKTDTHGKWMCKVQGISGGRTYRFSVEYLTSEGICDLVSVAVFLSWMDKSGKVLVRDYADDVSDSPDGWKCIGRVLEAPQDAAAVSIELGARWPKGDTVTFRKPFLAETESIVHRKVRLATVLLKLRHPTLEENLAGMLEMIDRAGQQQPDIICLGEKNYNNGAEATLSFDNLHETIPGPLTRAIGEKAKKYRCYIAFSMAEKEGDKYYNAGVLIDRNGEVAGKYRKTHLATSEAENGYTPGDDYPVFETDFGKVGFMICWDSWFPETARILRMKGAEVLLVPTNGDASIQTQARAVDNGVYVVVSGIARPESSRIINPLGEVIAQVEDSGGGVAVAEVDLDHKFYQYWLSVGAAYGETRSIYLKERRPDTYGDLIKG